ncbi:MAG: cyclase family protein [Acidimicrobiales bacterium]
MRELGERYSNWGRWGADDERGTANFITEQVVLAACAIPRVGRVVSCAIDFHLDGPMPYDEPTVPGARYNVQHRMTVTGEGLELPGGFQYADDTADLTLQGATQWDALSHVFYDGQMFNGFSSSLITSEGAGANSIDKMRNGVVSRGVLLDIARHQELPWLPDGTAILPDELDECALAQGLEIRPGDVVLIRTGRVGRALEEGWTESFVFGPNPGLSVHCAGWLHDSMIAAVGVDNVGVEVQPGEVDDCMMPLHMIALRNIGLTFGEIFNLELLGDACASLGRFEFLFTAPPLPILGAVGSPINPLAIL